MKTYEISMCVKCNQDNFPFYNTRDTEHRNFNQEVKQTYNFDSR